MVIRKTTDKRELVSEAQGCLFFPGTLAIVLRDY